MTGRTPRTPFQNSIYRGAHILAREGTEAFSRYLGLPSGSGRTVYQVARTGVSKFRAKRGLKFSKPKPQMPKEANQSIGNRHVEFRTANGGRKRFKPWKIVKGGLTTVCQNLIWRARDGSANDVPQNTHKYLMSEFNPGSGGFMPISLNTGFYVGTKVGTGNVNGVAYTANTNYGSDRNKIYVDPLPYTLSDTSTSTTVTLYGGSLPLHVYDLTSYIGNGNDKRSTSLPAVTTDMNGDINSRAWLLCRGSSNGVSNGTSWTTAPTTQYSFAPLGTVNSSNHLLQPRYRFEDDQVNVKTFEPNNSKVYHASSCLDMMFYGTKKMPTKFDVRVIRITDRRYCPDYVGTLSSYELATVREAWGDLSRPFTVSPLLKHIERRPKVKKWFKTVVKRTITLGEQTSEIDNLPCAQIRMHVNINELMNHAWQRSGITGDQGDDDVVAMDTDNLVDADPNPNVSSATGLDTRPWYSSRLYLVIRALCPMDHNTQLTNNADNNATLGHTWYSNVGVLSGSEGPKTGGLSSTDYTPSYDLIVRNYFTLPGTNN